MQILLKKGINKNSIVLVEPNKEYIIKNKKENVTWKKKTLKNYIMNH